MRDIAMCKSKVARLFSYLRVNTDEIVDYFAIPLRQSDKDRFITSSCR